MFKSKIEICKCLFLVLIFIPIDRKLIVIESVDSEKLVRFLLSSWQGDGVVISPFIIMIFKPVAHIMVGIRFHTYTLKKLLIYYNIAHIIAMISPRIAIIEIGAWLKRQRKQAFV